MITVADILAPHRHLSKSTWSRLSKTPENTASTTSASGCPPLDRRLRRVHARRVHPHQSRLCYDDPALSDASLIAMIERRVAHCGQTRVLALLHRCSRPSKRAYGRPRVPSIPVLTTNAAFRSLNLLQRDLDASGQKAMPLIGSWWEDRSLKLRQKKSTNWQVLPARRCVASPSRLKRMTDAHCTQFKIHLTIFSTRFVSGEEVQNACAFDTDALLVFVSYAIDEQRGDIFHDLENAIPRRWRQLLWRGRPWYPWRG